MREERNVVHLHARREATTTLKPTDAVAHMRAVIERIGQDRIALAANDEVREIRTVLMSVSKS